MNAHLIIIRYLGPSNTRPSRVILSSGRFPADRVTISFNHRFNDSLAVAADWLRANGYSIENSGEAASGYFATVREFIALKDAKAGKRWNRSENAGQYDLRDNLRALLRYIVDNSRGKNPWCSNAVPRAARALNLADGKDVDADAEY